MSIRIGHTMVIMQIVISFHKFHTLVSNSYIIAINDIPSRRLACASIIVDVNTIKAINRNSPA
ncbi:hypothetical protein [Prevotella sp. oral taxon 317]|uniref:hypothetical protein n=1 Tax=Prevotella sp. oral taxon 317 TaxID=652721 RepID=UPI001E59FBC3|nr:hypothetical protein [Prevotella sp. oral taxon 317]